MTTHYSQESASQLVRYQIEMIHKLQVENTALKRENAELKEEVNACYSQIQGLQL